MKQAPIFTRAYTFFSWLIERLEKVEQQAFLRGIILDTARLLMESLTLALQGFEPHYHSQRADEALALLRLHLRLGEDHGLLDEKQYLYAVESLDDIGRQLGGWLKSLNQL